MLLLVLQLVPGVDIAASEYPPGVECASSPGSVGAWLILGSCQPLLVLLFVGADCWLMMFGGRSWWWPVVIIGEDFVSFPGV